ncbi:hypothetical protein Zmor_026166 [Zophobas morio]|uniref:PLAT domain-containing protein n=1 Tax=Zophobas morio TaxID=2755281 RepID=A0AA38HU19_9CUCU|nr:hypothetical protein Zmor_026166 [Zophobas morio]
MTYTPAERVEIGPEWDGDDKELLRNYDFTYAISHHAHGAKGSVSNIPVTNLLQQTLDNIQKLVIPPNTFVPNAYNVTVHSKRKSSVKTGPANALEKGSKTCRVLILTFFPFAVISGGFRRVVPANLDIVVDGEGSFDSNFNNGTSSTLNFTWSCNQTQTPPTFCKKDPISTASGFTIPARHVKDGDTFTIKLQVKLKYLDEDINKNETQTVIVVANAPALEMICRKNCLSWTDYANYELITLFGASCVTNCEGLQDDDYMWSVKVLNDSSYKFDYSNSRYGKSGTKFLIEKNTLEKAAWYIVEVEAKTTQGRGYAALKMSYHRPAKVSNCKLDPPEGKSLETYYKFSCTQTPPNQPNFYEFLVRDATDISIEQTIVSGFHPDVFKRQFKLPPSEGKIFIAKATKISKESYPAKEVRVEGRVESALSDKPSKEVVQILDDIYNGNGTNQSIINLVSSNNPEDRSKAIEVFQSIVDELVVSKIEDQQLKDFLETLKYTASEDMLKAPLKSLEEVIKISQSLTKLQQQHIPAESDPLLSKFTSTVCKKMADRALETLRGQEFPYKLGDRMKKFSSTVAKCFETTTNPNYKIIKPIELNVSTETPIFDVPVITEDYPDYVDHDESYYKNLEYLKEASFNIVNGSATSAKVIAMATATGEGLVRAFGNQSETVVFKDTGSELTRSPVRATGVIVTVSSDFVNDEHSYDFLMTTWNNDILWWNPGFVKVYTNIINLEFWHSTCVKRIDSFKNPVGIYFAMKNKSGFVPRMREYFVNVAEGYATMTDDELNYQINVYRIALPTKRTLHVNFRGSNTSNVFNVVLLENKFPTVEDFVNNDVTFETDTSLRLANDYDYDILAYIGILVKKEAAAEKTTLTYGISTLVTCCIEFITLDSKWIPTCKPGNESNQTALYCICNHFSVIAGHIQNIQYIPQRVFKPDLELKLWYSLVIFSTLALTLLIFLLLLTLSLLQKKEQVYFVGDNDASHRFAYLVMIRTGEGYNAGTSSNIMIKLVGDKSFSEPHALNYPDPQLRILQQFNHDMFVLATENHLGKLTSLEIWFDSIGQNPDWYCKDILVYDLQEHTQWHFKIEEWISIVKGTTYLVAKPTQRKTPLEEPPFTKTLSFTKKFPFIRFKIDLSLLRRYHTWYLWINEENLSYIKKLTIMLSTMLTTCSLALVMLGQPSLKLIDGFERYHYYTIPLYSILVGFVCSFPTFLLHIAIAWCFRFSKIQVSKYEQDRKLSFRYTVACWSALLTLIALSTAYLIIIGFWVPKYASLIWLTTSAISIIIGVLLYEPIFFLGVNFFYNREIVYEIKKKFEDIFAAVEAQRDYLFATFGPQLLRPYFEHLYIPLKRRRIKELTILIKHRRFVISELQDLLMFVVYVIILYMVILADKDRLVVLGKMLMEDIIEGKHTRTVDFNDIETAHDIYGYINATLITSIQPLRWYGNFVVSEPGLMLDVANKYMGVTRLRQQRTKSGLCAVPEPLEFLNLSCWPEFARKHTETRTFGYRWGNFSTYINYDRLKTIWKYATQGQTATFPTFGEIAAYSGGGYVAYLGRTLYNSYVNFRQLLNKLWIDQATRVVFIEFLTYNANCNIFSSIRLTFEQSATGFVTKRVIVYTVRMLFVNNEVAYISTVFFTLFIIWVGLLMFKQSLGIVKSFRHFYKDPWLMIDFIIIVLSLLCIFFFALRIHFVGAYLEELETAKHNAFLSYFYLFYIEDFLTFAAAFLVCIATIRLWKFLRFAKMFRMMERTLAVAILPLLCFLIIFATVVMGAGMAFLLLVGKEFKRVRSLVKMIRLMLTMSLKASEMKSTEFLDYKVALFYMVLYIITLELSLFTFITIIVFAYAKAQWEFSSDLGNYTVRDYVLERSAYLRTFFTYKSKRLRAGLMEIVDSKVAPKSDKFLYRNSCSVSVPKMRLMKYITRGLIRKQTRKSSVLTSYDVKLMETICRQIFLKSGKDEVDVFFMGHVRGTNVKLVDEKRVEKIANITNLLLQENRLDSFIQEEKNPTLEKYVKAIKRRGSTLRQCTLNLKLILKKMKTAELKFSRV